jgi:hypothetical protein
VWFVALDVVALKRLGDDEMRVDENVVIRGLVDLRDQDIETRLDDQRGALPKPGSNRKLPPSTFAIMARNRPSPNPVVSQAFSEHGMAHPRTKRATTGCALASIAGRACRREYASSTSELSRRSVCDPILVNQFAERVADIPAPSSRKGLLKPPLLRLEG